MTWQEPVVLTAVGLAVAYLVWKLGFSGRPRDGKKDKKPRGPDVSVGRLTQKKKRRS